jgi:hypothetical protein
MNVFVLSAEHFSVPGLILQAHATRASAEAEAVTLVNTMLTDSGWQPLASPIQWQHHVERLQDAHGAAHCYVEIDEKELVGGADMLSELRKAESFISGFEGDDLQEGIAELLAGIRGAVAKAEGR